MPKGHDVVDMMVNLRSPSDIDCGPRFKLTEAEPHKVAKMMANITKHHFLHISKVQERLIETQVVSQPLSLGL